MELNTTVVYHLPKIRKFRLECKYKVLFSLPKRKISGENGIA